MRSCPRSGIAWLVANDAYESIYAIPTNCKTKGCGICRHKVKAKFEMLVQYGCLTLGRSYFTTLTLRAGPGLQKDALFVRAAWRKFLEFLRSRYETVEFVKVVELTKQKQPHLHVVLHLGQISLRARCQIRAKYDAKWRALVCDCLEHLFSAAWQRITGDSFVVDVSEVSSGKNAGSYLGKYLAKGIAYQGALRKLGFIRAWARSGGWPFDQISLSQTHKGGWKDKGFTAPGKKRWPSDKTSVAEWLARTEGSPPKREGTDLAIALSQDKQAKAEVSFDANLRKRLIRK